MYFVNSPLCTGCRTQNPLRFQPRKQQGYLDYEIRRPRTEEPDQSRKTNEETPTASPKGIHITFSADGGKNKARWTYVMSLDGKGKPRNITKGEGESNPVWSPTGTEIAFTALAGKLHLALTETEIWRSIPWMSS